MFCLSQDQDEIFLTFPSFDDSYGEDKSLKDLKQRDFLRMHECGPFKLGSMDDVSQLANFLLAYTGSKGGIM